ncbi:hypothetical protein QT381_03855 [Galbitalea sp. SE-J8]|uniref:DUF4232 domain-containing protein n=1 Tax=Galbitalea sp. SE-J8 TaxID=3054952 RepID=UPI00259CEE80|nr:DUF4232 domain-containing protein [Galbitalea sp. SE-J8]MDM4762139.1 hypothetical protein [Galbitalea sp. SE-J8]
MSREHPTPEEWLARTREPARWHPSGRDVRRSTQVDAPDAPIDAHRRSNARRRAANVALAGVVAVAVVAIVVFVPGVREAMHPSAPAPTSTAPTALIDQWSGLPYGADGKALYNGDSNDEGVVGIAAYREADGTTLEIMVLTGDCGAVDDLDIGGFGTAANGSRTLTITPLAEPSSDACSAVGRFVIFRVRTEYPVDAVRVLGDAYDRTHPGDDQTVPVLTDVVVPLCRADQLSQADTGWMSTPAGVSAVAVVNASSETCALPVAAQVTVTDAAGAATTLTTASDAPTGILDDALVLEPGGGALTTIAYALDAPCAEARRAQSASLSVQARGDASGTIATVRPLGMCAPSGHSGVWGAFSPDVPSPTASTGEVDVFAHRWAGLPLRADGTSVGLTIEAAPVAYWGQDRSSISIASRGGCAGQPATLARDGDQLVIERKATESSATCPLSLAPTTTTVSVPSDLGAGVSAVTLVDELGQSDTIRVDDTTTVVPRCAADALRLATQSVSTSQGERADLAVTNIGAQPCILEGLASVAVASVTIQSMHPSRPLVLPSGGVAYAQLALANVAIDCVGARLTLRLPGSIAGDGDTESVTAGGDAEFCAEQTDADTLTAFGSTPTVDAAPDVTRIDDTEIADAGLRSSVLNGRPLALVDGVRLELVMAGSAGCPSEIAEWWRDGDDLVVQTSFEQKMPACHGPFALSTSYVELPFELPEGASVTVRSDTDGSEASALVRRDIGVVPPG